MRGGVSPLLPQSNESILVYDRIGSNSGNLLYVNGVFRTLMTEDTEIDMDNYAGEGKRYTDKDIARINEEYDAYIVPLADAFRPDFTNKLNIYAELFRKLKIPCVIIGIGIRAPYEPNLNESFPFDDAAKNFVSAVLEKSAMIGVRGQITADYLKKLGFTEEKDYTIIGCPSMYTFGKHLEQRTLELGPESKISINFSQNVSENLLEYLINLTHQYENSQCVAQLTTEFATFYMNKGLEESRAKELYQRDKVRFFTSALDWFENMKHVDLSIGLRLHGNIAAILGGAPAIFIPHDGRMRELAEYHDFPCLMADKFRPGVPLEELVKQVNLSTHLKRHERNFTHFLDFLACNQLKNIYLNNPDRMDAPYDSRVSKERNEMVSAVLASKEEVLQRCLSYQNGMETKQNKKISALEKKFKNSEKKNNEIKAEVSLLLSEKENILVEQKKLEEENNCLKAENKKLNDIVNSRTVKLARKFRKIFK